MKRSLITSILISIGILLFTACETNQSMMDGYGTHGWGMGWWWIIVVIFLITIVWIVIKYVNQNQNSGSGKSALEILKERYASGEIDKQEFEEQKRIINSKIK